MPSPALKTVALLGAIWVLALTPPAAACTEDAPGPQQPGSPAPPGPSPPAPPPPPPPVPPGANVRVDDSQSFQTIDGWMVTLAGGWTYSSGLRDAVVEQAVHDLGINRIRLDVPGALEGNGEPDKASGRAVNDNGDPGALDLSAFTWGDMDAKVEDWVLPIRSEVEGRGEPFVLQVTYNGHAPSTAFQKNPDEYAEFVSAVLNRLRANWGIEPDYWEVANEPENEVEKNGLELGRMLKAAGDRARAEGFHKVRFSAPSVTNARNAVPRLEGLLNVPGAGGYLAELAYHRYRGGATLPVLHQIRDAARARGLRVTMTEFIGATHEMLNEDLTEADAAVWEEYTLACCGRRAPDDRERGGAYYIVFDDGTFRLSRRASFLRQYFRHIRPGAVRVAASSTDPAIQPVAFRTPRGGVVLVASVERASTLAIAGLPAGTYHVTFATDREPAGSAGDVTLAAGETITASIPAAGVVAVAP